MTDGPVKPLTTRQEQVAELLGRGLPYKRIAEQLGIKYTSVVSHVEEIAVRLPNPDELPAGTLAMLWAAHRRWLRDRERPERPAA